MQKNHRKARYHVESTSFFKVFVVAALPLFAGVFMADQGDQTPSDNVWAPSGVSSDLVIDLEGQQTNERSWKETEVDSILTLDGADAEIVNPLQVASSEAGLFVVDFGDMRIKQFDWSGQYVKGYGRRGSGPGEFANPTDVGLADGVVWVADGGARRLSRFEGDTVETQAMESGIVRVAPTSATSAFIMTNTPTGDGLFMLMEDEEIVSTFGHIVENQPRNAIALDGRIASDGENMFYSSFYGGFLLSYDQNGDLRFAVETFNHKELPEVQETERRGARIRRIRDEDKEFINADISIDENGIHLFSIKGTREESSLVIDTYSLEDGSYKYSTKARRNIRNIRVFDDMHVGIENDTLVTAYWYRFEQ